MDKIMIFGIGSAYDNLMKQFDVNFDVVKIVALIDNDARKQGTKKNNFFVYSPNEAIKQEYDYILVLGKFHKEIVMQLCSMGVKKEKVILECEIEHYKHWLKPKALQMFCNESTLSNLINMEKWRPIALFGSLIYAGGPLALLRMAQVLKKNNYDIMLVVRENGPALKECTKFNFPVLVDCNVFNGMFFKSTWLSNCSVIVLNGIQAAPLISKLPSDVPIIWWLHDPEEYYSCMNFTFRDLSLKNVDVYAVSDFAWNPLKKRFPSLQKQLLFYGVPKMIRRTYKNVFKDKLIFAVLGKVHYIKGQDIFLEAVSLLPNEKRFRCEFWVVGNANTKFADDLREKSARFENFKILGEFDQDQIYELFAEISVVVTPSRMDMMPTANVEAMMFGIPCIISENAGTSEFILNGYNGLIMKRNDPQDLAVKMEWMIDNWNKLELMGKRSTSIYKKYFSMNVFERNVLDIIEKNIGKK